MGWICPKIHELWKPPIIFIELQFCQEHVWIGNQQVSRELLTLVKDLQPRMGLWTTAVCAVQQVENIHAEYINMYISIHLTILNSLSEEKNLAKCSQCTSCVVSIRNYWLCKYFYSKQYCTQVQIFTSFICKAWELLQQSWLAVKNTSKSDPMDVSGPLLPRVFVRFVEGPPVEPVGCPPQPWHEVRNVRSKPGNPTPTSMCTLSATIGTLFTWIPGLVINRKIAPKWSKRQFVGSRDKWISRPVFISGWLPKQSDSDSCHVPSLMILLCR